MEKEQFEPDSPEALLRDLRMDNNAWIKELAEYLVTAVDRLVHNSEDDEVPTIRKLLTIRHILLGLQKEDAK